MIEHAVNEWNMSTWMGVVSAGKKQTYVLSPDQFNTFINGEVPERV